MPARTASHRIARLLASTGLIVLVLGVLPFAWGASPVWRVVGSLTSVALVVHATQVVWREVFSTRHLSDA